MTKDTKQSEMGLRAKEMSRKIRNHKKVIGYILDLESILRRAMGIKGTLQGGD